MTLSTLLQVLKKRSQFLENKQILHQVSDFDFITFLIIIHSFHYQFTVNILKKK